jgi:hypothetical protein
VLSFNESHCSWLDPGLCALCCQICASLFCAVLDSDTNPLNQLYALVPDSQHLCSVSMNPIVASLIQAFVHSVVRSVHPSFVLTDCCGLWQRENYQKTLLVTKVSKQINFDFSINQLAYKMQLVKTFIVAVAVYRDLAHND